jgi:hypothetical protein
MNAFVNAATQSVTRTTNGMKAQESTGTAVMDLFYNIGAMRGKNVTAAFAAAKGENRELALRVAAWARDARGGAGERQLFRDILVYLEANDPEACQAMIAKVPELGRWDDLFVLKTLEMKGFAYSMLGDALRSGNGLAAKWTPRKGRVAAEIRNFFGMTPKQYRKSLVELTNVVEQKMCAGDWDNINFSHVPSVAAARYKKAFQRHTPKYAEYVAKLVKGDDPKVKINAGAVYPYDVIKNIYDMSAVQKQAAQAQWDALPNFVGDANILPMVDVSGSMTCKAGGYGSKSELSCMDVAVSLGLYLADKNKGAYNGMFLTFSATPSLKKLTGGILDKLNQMQTSEWGMSTNLMAAFDKVLKVAKDGKVPQEDMPKAVLILSDMQFDQCARFDDSAYDGIKRRYQEAGYEMPAIVFWNLNAAYGNAPVSFDKRGVALVSGFSPAIVKPIVSGNLKDMSPYSIMLKTIMQDRYSVI